MYARNPASRVEEMSEKKIQVNLLVFRLAMLRMRKDNDEIMRLSQELEKRLRTPRVSQ